jgi:fructokinase
MDYPLVIGIELGGTKCFAVLARGTDVLCEARVPTTVPGETLAALSRAIDGWGVPGVAAIGVGAFGPVALDPARADYGRMLATPKPGWQDTDVLWPFRRAGVAIAIDSDVGAAALAEGRWGAARGCGTHAYVTVGTGIGVGLVANGATVRGFLHPEFGHLRVRRLPGDRFAGICPWHGDCVEGLASGTAIAARAGRPGDVLAADDPVWELVAADLAEMVAALLLAAAPERIVFGGGVGLGQGAHLLPRVRAGVAARLNGYLPLARAGGVDAIIVAAGLAERAGPLGCVALALGAIGR